MLKLAILLIVLSGAEIGRSNAFRKDLTFKNKTEIIVETSTQGEK